MAHVKNEKTCFVIMPFSEQCWEVFEFGIAPACKSTGSEAVRVDQLKGPFQHYRFSVNLKIEALRAGLNSAHKSGNPTEAKSLFCGISIVWAKNF